MAKLQLRFSHRRRLQRSLGIDHPLVVPPDSSGSCKTRHFAVSEFFSASYNRIKSRAGGTERKSTATVAFPGAVKGRAQILCKSTRITFESNSRTPARDYSPSTFATDALCILYVAVCAVTRDCSHFEHFVGRDFGFSGALAKS